MTGLRTKQRAPQSHAPSDPVRVETIVYYRHDLDLANAWAPMTQWLQEHPCECQALCTCEAA